MHELKLRQLSNWCNMYTYTRMYRVWPFLLRVQRVAQLRGAKRCMATWRTASGRDAGFSLATRAECHVATYRSSIGYSACFGLTTGRTEWHVAPCRNALWLRRLLCS
jgi:hypothetical protein